MSIHRCVRRTRDGGAEPIPPSEYDAWFRLTGNICTPAEFEILCAMDQKFCEVVGSEISDYYERIRAEAEQRNNQ